jgi:hypothetical protein
MFQIGVSPSKRSCTHSLSCCIIVYIYAAEVWLLARHFSHRELTDGRAQSTGSLRFLFLFFSTRIVHCQVIDPIAAIDIMRLPNIVYIYRSRQRVVFAFPNIAVYTIYHTIKIDLRFIAVLTDVFRLSPS